MKKIDVSVLGEVFELNLEDDFYEFVKEDLEKLQNPRPKDLLYFFLKKAQNEYKLQKELKSILERIEDEKRV